MKSKRIRDLFDGKAVILIRDGCIDQQMMRKERYSIDDLMSQLWQGSVFPDEVAFAILETTGRFPSCQRRAVRYPHPLISDGVIDRELRSIGKDREWLTQQLGKQGTTAEAVFLCLYQKDGLFVIRRQLH
ncbi:MAG: DUF421 domain-containing protein [Merdibacter sp.]